LDELDVWQYIEAEGIDVVPLYFAKERRSCSVAACGSWSMTTACRSNRTSGRNFAGCASARSAAIPDRRDRLRGRDGRRDRRRIAPGEPLGTPGPLIDSDSDASMERKKREGYF